jgi:hypothetical protein
MLSALLSQSYIFLCELGFIISAQSLGSLHKGELWNICKTHLKIRKIKEDSRISRSENPHLNTRGLAVLCSWKAKGAGLEKSNQNRRQHWEKQDRNLFFNPCLDSAHISIQGK